MDIQKCIFSEEFLPLTYKWLNDKEIKSLTNTPDFTKESQKKWFLAIRNNDSYKIWGICIHKKSIGVFGIKNINDYSGEYWGYIGEKEYWGKGIGKWMMKESIIYGKDIGLSKIYLHVFYTNKRAIKLYLNKGFKIISSENNLIKMEKLL